MCQSDLQDLSAHQQWTASMNEIFIRDTTTTQRLFYRQPCELQRGANLTVRTLYRDTFALGAQATPTSAEAGRV